MTIEYSTLTIPHSVCNSGNDLPAMEKVLNMQNKSNTSLPEDEGLFIGFGRRDNAYPYTNQGDYMEMSDAPVKTVVLENEHLKAVFLPEYGGRLWSLTDKEYDQNLLYTNDVLKMRNLAIRNAWFSGGVEWNIGAVGHSVFTCEPLYVAEVSDESGNKVLRMYEYERVRGVCYQMDFWLQGKELLCRVRIDNRNNTLVPMYWWSNIAVPEFDGGRVIAPGFEAYTNNEEKGVYKIDLPYVNGIDISHYNDIPYAIDYFFDIKDNRRKFEANVDGKGVGLLHYSTSRLEGRKLFSWGHSQGAKQWQSFLTDNAGDYIEIQAGLAKSQYECIPMPPKTVWEWIESYSRIELDEASISGSFEEAIDAVEAVVESRFVKADLEVVLRETKGMAKEKGVLVEAASGYGAMASEIGKEQIPPHLEFRMDNLGEEWKTLLESGIFKSTDTMFTPDGYVEGSDFTALLEAALDKKETNRAYTLYHLGIIHYSAEDYMKSYECLKESLELDYNPYTLFALAYSAEHNNDDKCYDYAIRAIKCCPDYYEYVEKMMKLLLDGEQYELLLTLKPMLEGEHVNNRIKMYFAYAYAYTGQAEMANQLLMEDGGLVIDDMREGERSIGKLWMLLNQAAYESGQMKLPDRFDFRMTEEMVNRKEVLW